MALDTVRADTSGLRETGMRFRRKRAGWDGSARMLPGSNRDDALTSQRSPD